MKKHLFIIFMMLMLLAGVAGCCNRERQDVYAGGYSRNSSNVAVPGYWKNGTWVELPPHLCDRASICYVTCHI